MEQEELTYNFPLKLRKIPKKELDYFDKKGNPVIVNEKALRDIEEGELLVSYGKILNTEDIK